MKKSNRFIFMLMAAWTFIYFAAGAWEKYFGTAERAVVITPPYNCDGRPRMIVSIGGNEHKMRPGRRACEDGRYQKGTVLFIKQHPITRAVMYDRAIPEVMLGVLVLFAVFLWVRRR